jgi:hypothetical protein
LGVRAVLRVFAEVPRAPSNFSSSFRNPSLVLGEYRSADQLNNRFAALNQFRRIRPDALKVFVEAPHAAADEAPREIRCIP